MPRPRQLPEHAELVRHLVAEKLTQVQVAERYGVTQGAVSRALARGNSSVETVDTRPAA